MLLMRTARSVLCLAVLLSLVVACNTRKDDDEFTPGELNGVLNGDYFYVEFARSVSSTITPDIVSRAGLASADGLGLLTFGPVVGTPPPAAQRAYNVDSLRRIDGSSATPGATLGTGDAFSLADLDRTTGDNVGLALFTRAAQNMTVGALVDSPTTNTRYHAVHYVFLRPGVENGKGTAEIAWASDTQAGWKIDLTLSNASTLNRYGTLSLAPSGNLVASDLTTGRNYVGAAEPHGDWIVWIETDTGLGRAVRLDVLLREGSGLSDATLNGRFNIVGFLQVRASGDVDTAFGDITFDGRGNYSNFQWRNSNGQSIPPSALPQPYTVASAGVVSLLGDIGSTGYVTRSSDRRWLVFPRTDASGTVSIFFALKR
jgi:hypothetical protein